MDTPLNARAALLQALLAGPGYGLQLIARLADSCGGRFTWNEGSVYPALISLESAGLVQILAETPPEHAGRPPRYYELTPAGRVAAEDQRKGLRGILGSG